MLQKKDKLKIIFFKESTFKVAEIIFNYPNMNFFLRGLARELKLSTTAVKKAIDELSSYKIINIEDKGITTNISANLESNAYYFYKKIFNLYRLERYNIINTLKDEFSADTIVLFGSFAKGEDIEKSDVDLLVITNHKEKEGLREFLSSCGKELNRRINLHVLSSLEKSSSEFKNAVANGIVLHGYIKVI